MVAGKKDSKHYLDFTCGWTAGCIETCVLFPPSKVIFRQQLHGFTLITAFEQLRSEGWGRLYRGLLPPLIMRTSSRALMFGLYDHFQGVLSCPHSPPNSSLSFCHTQAAFLAGICEASLCPLERVQVVLQTTKYHDQYKNTAQAFKALRVYGIREYYRGMSVICTRNSTSNALFFTLREPFKKLIMDSKPPIPEEVLRIVADFVSGAVLGATISTLFFPMNVVKNRMQSTVGTPFENPFKVFGRIWNERNGSIKGMYLGVHLNFTRSLLAWGITNTTYELLRRSFHRFDDL